MKKKSSLQGRLAKQPIYNPMDDSNPPLMTTYKHLFDDHPLRLDADDRTDDHECDLPVIDLALLDGESVELCRADIVHAASEWGFFQVTNHGVPQALLDKLHDAQVGVFRRPFERKVGERLLDFSSESYRWGTPTATCLKQLSWSEAYHIPITLAAAADQATVDKTRLVIEEVATAMSQLAQQLASILIRDLGDSEGDEDDGVAQGSARTSEMMRGTRNTCFLRLNRYPPCGMASGAFGLCPHTDSDFITILHQDHVGGLQLLKAGRWLTVKPNPNALIVNIGDLLQAWSNDLYRSVEHRVMANATLERFSVAFFLCPSSDTVIRPHSSSSSSTEKKKTTTAAASLYRSFTFGEYRNQVMEDVRLTGRKIGLQRFRLLQDGLL